MFREQHPISLSGLKIVIWDGGCWGYAGVDEIPLPVAISDLR